MENQKKGSGLPRFQDFAKGEDLNRKLKSFLEKNKLGDVVS